MVDSNTADLQSLLQRMTHELKVQMQAVQEAAKEDILQSLSQQGLILQSVHEALTRNHGEGVKGRRVLKQSGTSPNVSSPMNPKPKPATTATAASASPVLPYSILPGEPPVGEPPVIANEAANPPHKPKCAFDDDHHRKHAGISDDVTVFAGTERTSATAASKPRTLWPSLNDINSAVQSGPGVTTVAAKTPARIENYLCVQRTTNLKERNDDELEGNPDTLEAVPSGRKQVNLGSQSPLTGFSVVTDFNFWGRLVKNPAFDLFSAFLILGSTTLIGVETDYAARHSGSTSAGFKACGTAMLAMFTVELIIRVLGCPRIMGFLTSDVDRSWNIFDTFMVLSGLAEVFFDLIGIDMASGSSTSRVLRILRVIRITRAMRLGRIMRYARTFRQIAFALQSSVGTLFWAMIVIFLIVYCFAIAMCQAATFHLVETADLPGGHDQQYIRVLKESYNNVPNSLYTLFMSMTSGISWGEVCGPIMSISSLYGFLFIFYISMIFFGVLNIVTAIFVDSAMQSQQHYKDLLIQESQLKKQMYTQHLREVFQKIDHDHSGVVTADEVEFFLTDPALNLYLASMDIFPNDAHALFRMLDEDGSGEVSIDEFCEGCLRLKGEAKSYDIHCLLYSNSKLDKRLQCIIEHLGVTLHEIDDTLCRRMSNVSSPSNWGDQPAMAIADQDEAASERALL